MLENEQQVENLYFHKSSDLAITVGQDDSVEKKEYAVNPIADASGNRQFIAHWVPSDNGVQLKTEKVVREGIFPYAEEELKQAQERDRQNADRAFKFLEKELIKSKKK